MSGFWSVIAQAARLVLEYAESKHLMDRPIAELVKEAWGTREQKRERA